jgi:hypothetical protein
MMFFICVDRRLSAAHCRFEFGSLHCQTDNRLLGSNYMSDWLAETLQATLPRL